MNTKNEMLFVVCDCYEHAISVEVFDKENKMTLVRFWQAYSDNVGLVERLKRAWRVFRYGKLDYDDVILDLDGMSKLLSNISDVTKSFGV
jgi:hypothetical protein